MRIILRSLSLYSPNMDTLKAELKGRCFVSGFEPTQTMEPSAILLASPPRDSDSAFQMVSGILEPSGPMHPTGSIGSLELMEPIKATRDTGLVPTGILEDGTDLSGGWVIEEEERPRASKIQSTIWFVGGD
jgi:hypothetical protein